MARKLALIGLVLLGGATIYVASTPGFPSTHRLAHSFFQDDLGLGARTANRLVLVVRKGFHVPAYALLAALVWWALPEAGKRVWIAVAIPMAVGVADELVQTFQPQRTGRVTDLLVDLVGVVLGLWIAGAFRRQKDRA